MQIFTEDGPAAPTQTGSLAAGSWGTTRAGLKFGGQAGGLNYIASASRFDTDGYRDHSEASKEQFNSKLRVNLGESGTLTFVLNYLNVNGVQGALKRDEDNTVDSWGAYAQGELQISEPLSLSAGLRFTRVSFESEDHFIRASNTGLCAEAGAGTNPDDSGKAGHSAWAPVIGALYRITPELNVYTNLWRSFETPTLIEMAYRTDGGAGLNFGLRPSKSVYYEVGVKALAGKDTRIDLALFMIGTKDEIVVFKNSGGRATFQNAGDSRRKGVELAVDSNLPGGFNAFFAATWPNAEFRDSYTTCALTPCATPNVLVSAGNKIPGVPRTTLYGEVSWKLPAAGFSTGLESRWGDKVFSNDSNTAVSESYFVMNLRAGFEQKLGKLVLREFARVDNLLGEQYVSAVFVNDANSRFYAPVPERGYFGGITAFYAF